MSERDHRLELPITPSDALIGKVALVMDADRALSTQIALGCSIRGADLIFHYRSDVDVDRESIDLAMTRGRQCTFVQGDIELEATRLALQNAIHKGSGRVDVFVSNCHQSHPTPCSFIDLSEEAVDQLVSKALVDLVDAVQAVLPFMASGGCLVNVAYSTEQISTAGFFKEALIGAAAQGLFLSLEQEYHNLRFSSVRLPPETAAPFPGAQSQGISESEMAIIADLLRWIELQS